ncbi:MAG: ubiquinone/menaquinone biosynthesis C-methylase UbiE [Pseudohongiellaceae bacterium]|jgi:ubiquinone/menaquinone biosynthesis C-methylase UbiE
MLFKDHFSGHAEVYAQARPTYPAELFDYLNSVTSGTDLAWDCATGNGQSAVALAGYFDQVIATDGSAAQIDAAKKMSNIDYRVALAEDVILDPVSADLICVSQALHWFELERFFQVVDAVLKPGGVLAVWSYGIHTIDEKVDKVIGELYQQTLDGYWPHERLLVEQAYKTIEFPYEKIPSPEFTMSLTWTQGQVEAYLRSWSAVQKYIKAYNSDPVVALSDQLKLAWGNEPVRTVVWPLVFILCRKP